MAHLQSGPGAGLVNENLPRLCAMSFEAIGPELPVEKKEKAEKTNCPKQR